MSIGNSPTYISHVGKPWRTTYVGRGGKHQHLRLYECAGCGARFGIEVAGNKVPFCLGYINEHGSPAVEFRVPPKRA